MAMSPRRPRIGVLLGDPSGIGPEVVTKMLARPHNSQSVDVVILTDRAMLAAGEAVAKARVNAHVAKSWDDVGSSPGQATLMPLELIPASEIVIGKSSVPSGRAAMKSIEAAVAAAKGRQIDGFVFGPLNKHAMHLAGLGYEDEMRFMKALFGHDNAISEFNITGSLWTSRVTSHIPLKDVSSHITFDGVCEAIRILDTALKDSGIARPRVAVAGLNPHAGDNGSIGREEIEVIGPAAEAMRRAGIDAVGPLSPDTMFLTAKRDNLNGVVSMYHDQGQIAMKLMGFANGVTLHGGQPVPITTCASGSAFDIAGKGVANAEGIQAAFDVCVGIARARIEKRAS
ncbi:MAG: 4-hydroxythreonine-4-phosphate dehydrogenase PdxA [Alphaproteobacteria bacterium]|nr:4-hydroxythreonine-4-phosphate dehydrogenase PdxA [Alphaproteobacteria bacterium]